MYAGPRQAGNTNRPTRNVQLRIPTNYVVSIPRDLEVQMPCVLGSARGRSSEAAGRPYASRM
eukprot:6360615-Lingulodinium_polyedra.AAC.1